MFLIGFLTSAGLIIAIGAQNAFVLRQGVLRQHVLPIVLLCTLTSACLISCGVWGFGQLIASSPKVLQVTTILGVVFLVCYGLSSMKRSFSKRAMPSAMGQNRLRVALVSCLGFTLLNPHVYLDTVVLMGALSANYDDREKLLFLGGAITASSCWFFSLGFGAGFLSPLFQSTRAWRIMDRCIGVMMIVLAAKLLAGLVR